MNKDGTWELLIVWNDWSLRRGGRNWKIDCSIIGTVTIKSQQPEFLDHNKIFQHNLNLDFLYTQKIEATSDSCMFCYDTGLI